LTKRRTAGAQGWSKAEAGAVPESSKEENYGLHRKTRNKNRKTAVEKGKNRSFGKRQGGDLESAEGKAREGRPGGGGQPQKRGYEMNSPT